MQEVISVRSRAFWRTALPLALPIALQNLLMVSFRLVDTIMIGRLGDVSIAAVGLAGQLSFFVELIVFGLASGSAVFIAQYHGANDPAGIRRTFGATMLFAVPVGLFATLVGLLLPGQVMRILTDDAGMIAEGARYLRCACFSYLGLTLFQGMSTVLRSTEQVRAPMLTSVVASVLNAVLNYVFIFGKLGLPAMGVMGAGLATAISSLVNPLLLFVISVKRRSVFITSVQRLLTFPKGFLRLYFSRVTPVLLNETLWSLSVVGLNMIFGRMGADNYAAMTVFRTFENFVFIAYVGICNACNIIVGKHIGAGQLEEAKGYAKSFLKLVPVFGVILGAALILLRAPLLSLFDISDTARATAMALLLVYGIENGLRNVPYLCVVGIFRAGGDTLTGMIGDIAIQYLLVLPAAFVCGLVLKLPFVLTYLVSLLSEDVIKSVWFLLRFRSMRWIRPVAGVLAGQSAETAAECAELERANG